MKDTNRLAIYIVLSTLFCQISITNSRTSTLWKLNTDEGKIKGLADEIRDSFIKSPVVLANEFKDDKVFNIIISTVASYGTSSWSKQSSDTNCEILTDVNETKVKSTKNYTTGGNRNTHASVVGDSAGVGGGGAVDEQQKQLMMKKINRETSSSVSDTLDCGKPVNFTYYDYLIGVGQRFNHPMVPEPEVAYLFLKHKDERSYKNFDIGALEKRLKRAKKEKPRSVHLYNQIGNYWRIKGDARQSIECFRRALAISPTNAEVLLNLARVLFNLQYLDDAIHLTRRSLEVQSPDRSAWRQYFTLGEIFKAYGHFQESLHHLRQALDLYPQHEPILKALRDVESIPNSPLHVYTILIIMALVLAVFIVVLTSTDSVDSQNSSSEFEPKMQRHFNRAMAMRSLKGFSSRTFKHRKY